MSNGKESLDKSPRTERARHFLTQKGVIPFSIEELSALSDQYSEALKSGVEGKPSSRLPNIANTFLKPITISELPFGKTAEVWEFGGTWIRWGQVVAENGRPLIKGYQQAPVNSGDPSNPKHYKNAEDFFIRTVSNIAREKVNRPDAIGIVWAFPAVAKQSINGIDVISPENLPKGFVIPGIGNVSVGKTLVELLGHGNIPTAVANDTAAVAIAGEEGAGGIVGTGSNIAVTARGNLYNTESGAFKSDLLLRNSYVKGIDDSSDNKGLQWAEKNIGGMYLEQQLQRILEDLIGEKLLTVILKKPATPEIISCILSNAKKGLSKFFPENISTDDFNVLHYVSSTIASRSAQLVGMMIGSAVKAFEDDYPDGEVSVPMEGSVYTKIPGYPDIINKTAEAIAQKPIATYEMTSGGMKGAGVAALSFLDNK